VAYGRESSVGLSLLLVLPEAKPRATPCRGRWINTGRNMAKKFEPILTLVQDSREQLPLDFSKYFDNIRVEALSFGDYMMEVKYGPEEHDRYVAPISVDRKGLGDLYGTLTRTENHDRFLRELERAKDESCHMVLAIETNLSTTLQGYEHSTVAGNTMMKILATMRVRYDLEVLFFSGRGEMTRWIAEVFQAFHRNWEKMQRAQGFAYKREEKDVKVIGRDV